MKKVISTVGLLLFAAGSSLCFHLSHQAFAEDRDAGSAPDVITTLTDEETQQRDRLRPKYLQPTPIEGKPEVTSLPIDPRQGETIVFVGNSLAERMEHHNFFEASLQQTFADKELTFRNMGFPGHTPGFRPEAGKNEPWAFPGAKEFHPGIKAHLGEGHYPSPDEWLTITKASTIVAFFGFNESYDGMQGLENFKNELRAFVD
ncbi:MAG: membrane-bound dehydrogenase, partial [Rubripirellula sp.]